ncbi:hypothetical protein [Marisediminicola senii]|uniref:hypothetical protein n=1 Tax=Marisediminicola senii TaxID=2711233 RepID=UPI0013ED0FF8|nr:hypothetical protein [Marisediminicola senii]
MTREFDLTDSLSLGDLRVYLARAARVDDGGAVRLVATGGVLAAYVAVLHPVGLLDSSPTVLGLRTFAVEVSEPVDAVVPLRQLVALVTALQDEVMDAMAPVTVTLPDDVRTAGWAAISPPRSGWTTADPIDDETLQRIAREGIAEVATAVPTGTGEQIVHKVRSEVWGRPVAGRESIVAGGAFAAVSLGFLGGGGGVAVYETGPWTRLSTARGHVLIKGRGGSLLR